MKTYWTKSALIALVPAALVGLLVFLAGPDALLVKISKNFLGIFPEVSYFISRQIGQGGSFKSFYSFLWADGLALSAFLITYFFFLGALRVPMWFGRSLIEIIWPAFPDILDPTLEKSGADESDPFASTGEFVARKGDMQILNRFAGSPKDNGPIFMFVTGREGIGKTRLALEWLKFLKNLKGRGDWDVGVLDPHFSIKEIEECRFRRKTAILIDEPGRIKDFWDVLEALLKKPGRLRIVLAEQYLVSLPSNSSQILKFLKAAQREPLRLAKLEDEELEQISPDINPETRKLAEGRPLFVLLGDEPDEELARRAKRRLEIAEKENGGPEMLALASLAGPAAGSSLISTLGISRQNNSRRLQCIFEGESRAVLKKTIPRIRPEPLADHIAVQFAVNCTEVGLSELLDAAIAANAEAVAWRLASLWRRGKWEEEAHEALVFMQEHFDNLRPEFAEATLAEAIKLVNELAEFSKQDNLTEDGFASFEQTAMRLENVVGGRPFDREIQRSMARGAVNAMVGYGLAGRLEEMEGWGARLLELAHSEAFKDDPEIRLYETGGAFIAMGAYGRTTEHFEDLERWGAILIKVAQSEVFKDDPEIRLNEASAAVIAMNAYGATGEYFNEMKRWEVILIDLTHSDAYVGNHEFRIQEAKGAVKAIAHYGKTGEHFDEMEVWGARLLELSHSEVFKHDHEIRLLEVSGIANAMDRYGETLHHFKDLERWGAMLIEVTQSEAFKGDPEIRLQEARAAVNAMNAYCITGECFADMERWGTILLDVAHSDVFQGDREIRLQEAMGACNVMQFYGATGVLFVDLERWGARLIELTQSETFKDDRDFRRLEAHGVHKAIDYYGRVGLFEDAEIWGKRLIDLIDREIFASDTRIRAEEACAAKDALFAYNRAGKQSGLAAKKWYARLAAVARAFPGELDIQEKAGKHMLTYSEQMMQGWPHGKPENL